MSFSTFQFYVLWFRIQRFVRAGARPTGVHLREIRRGLPGLFRWLRSLFLSPLAISFEVNLLAWERLEKRIEKRYHYHLHGWHRTLFCAALSLTLWQAVLLIITGGSLSGWTFVFSIAHGLAIQIFWKRGARYFRHLLAVRPLRNGGLDLGN